MGKLIDADALIARLRKSAESNPGTIASALCELVCGDIELEPEAIVRCKDCKHRDPEDKKCDCGHDILWQLPRDNDWFCADAERRTDE